MPDYPTSAEIQAQLQALRDDVANAPFCSIATLTPTHGGRPWTFMRVIRGLLPRPKFLVTGGIHGNEWAPPAAVLSFIRKLLTAYHANVEIRQGTFVVTAQEVRDIVDRIDIYVAPICNPDGYDLSRTTIPANDLIGRKNGRPSTAPCAAPGFSGVNINRNFDIVWDFDVKYAANTVGSSRNECNPNFIGGPAAFSEPEAQNVRTILDEGIEYYIDCHMFGPLIFHSWGIETNQSATPAQNFHNTAFDGIRDGTAGAAYAEHILAADETDVRDIGNMMAAAINQSTSANYTVQLGSIPTSLTGAADDYAYSRHLDPNIPGRPKIFAYTLESGDSVIRFRPDFVTEFPTIELEIHAAILRFLLWILQNRTSPPPPTPTPPTTPPTTTKPCCIFSVLAGTQLAPAIEFLRAIRDVALRETARGRRFATLLERAYAIVSPPAAKLMTRHERVRRAVAAWFFRPAVTLLRAAHAKTSRFRTPARRVDALIAAIAGPPLALTIGALAVLAAALLR